MQPMHDSLLRQSMCQYSVIYNKLFDVKFDVDVGKLFYLQMASEGILQHGEQNEHVS